MPPKLGPQAKKDIKAIWLYVAKESGSAIIAESLLKRFTKTFLLIAANPGIGISREELSPNVRSIPVGPYIVYYHNVGISVEIIRVIHGARDIHSFFE